MEACVLQDDMVLLMFINNQTDNWAVKNLKMMASNYNATVKFAVLFIKFSPSGFQTHG